MEDPHLGDISRTIFAWQELAEEGRGDFLHSNTTRNLGFLERLMDTLR